MTRHRRGRIIRFHPGRMPRSSLQSPVRRTVPPPHRSKGHSGRGGTGQAVTIADVDQALGHGMWDNPEAIAEAQRAESMGAHVAWYDVYQSEVSILEGNPIVQATSSDPGDLDGSAGVPPRQLGAGGSRSHRSGSRSHRKPQLPYANPLMQNYFTPPPGKRIWVPMGPMYPNSYMLMPASWVGHVASSHSSHTTSGHRVPHPRIVIPDPGQDSISRHPAPPNLHLPPAVRHPHP